MGVLNRFKPLTVGAAAAPGLQQSPHTGHPYSSPQGLPTEQRLEQKPEQKKENNLLAGSRALGSIPHGIAAVPGLPYPVTIDLTSMTVGPNNTSTSLKDCSIIAVAGADLSTSRVLLQPKTLNCYRGGEYLSLAVDGYVVDLTDNNSGLHGTVEGRSGKYLWGMIAGSFAGGIGKAFAAGETTSTVSAEGVSTTTVTGDKLKYGLTSGGAASADELARWFKERANKLVDYVQVPPLDAVTVIFTSSVHVPDGGPMVNRKEMSWVK
ncbi:MAG: TrbI/VirB10 family protein [Thermodesulfovibrionales bacterium]